MPDELRGQAARAYLVFAEGYVFNKKELRDYLQAALAAEIVPAAGAAASLFRFTSCLVCAILDVSV